MVKKKGWRKVGGDDWVSGTHVLSILSPFETGGKMYKVSTMRRGTSKVTIKLFKTRSQALRYAKAFMRKN